MTRQPVMAMSHAWKNPQFNTIEGFDARIRTLSKARKEPLEHKGQLIDGLFAIVDDATGKYYGKATSDYEVVNNADLLMPLAHILAENNIPVKGTVMESPNGSMRAELIVGSPFSIRDSPYMFRCSIVNSYNAKLVVNAVLDLIRQVCTNGMMGIAGLCSSMQHKHIEGANEAVDEWLGLFNASEKIMEELPKTVERGMSQPLNAWETVRLLRGVGIKQRSAVEITDNLSKYNPEINRLGMNAWTVYNAGNNYYSHRQKGEYETNAEGIRTMGRILTDNLQSFISEGHKILEAEQSAKPIPA